MTFKKILEAAKKNSATEIFMSPNNPIYVKTRDTLKALTKQDATLSTKQIEQLIEKLTENTDFDTTEEQDSFTTYYRIPNINFYKVNITRIQTEPIIHLQVINNELPSSSQLNTLLLDRNSNIKQGIVLLTGRHQNGLTHSLNSVLDFVSIKNEKLIALVTKKNPWLSPQSNSMTYTYNYTSDAKKSIQQAIKNNCDYLFIDDLTFDEFEKIGEFYSFDRPTYVTLNFESLIQALKIIKLSPIYLMIQHQLKLISHQKLIFSHKKAQFIPLIEYATPSEQFYNLMNNESLLNSILSISNLPPKDIDEGLFTIENSIAYSVKNNLISSQQGAQMSKDPNHLMRLIASDDGENTSQNSNNESMSSSPELILDEEWTSIENIPVDDDDDND